VRSRDDPQRQQRVPGSCSATTNAVEGPRADQGEPRVSVASAGVSLGGSKAMRQPVQASTARPVIRGGWPGGCCGCSQGASYG